MEKINVLSPQLTKIVNEARPKHGQVIYFESLRPQGGGTSVRNIDRIFDPYVENEDGTHGAYTDIGFVIGQLPATGTTPARHNFGRIQFSKSTDNIIPVSGANRGDDTLFQYLFLTNWNKSNQGKPWYSPTDGQMPLFNQMKPAMKAKDENAFRRNVMSAVAKIEDMTNEKLVDLAVALDMRNINKFSDMEEIKNQLFKIADKNPERIMGMDKDINLNMKLLIKEALKYNIWEEDRALKLFVWKDTQEPVFATTPGSDLYSSAIKFFQGSGDGTHSLLRNLVDKAKKKEQAKKSFVPQSNDETVDKIVEKATAAGDNKPEKKFVVSKDVVEVKE